MHTTNANRIPYQEGRKPIEEISNKKQLSFSTKCVCARSRTCFFWWRGFGGGGYCQANLRWVLQTLEDNNLSCFGSSKLETENDFSPLMVM